MNKSLITILSVSVGLLFLLFILPSSVKAALTVGSTSITTDSTLSLQGGNVGIGDLTPVAALVVGTDGSAGVANGTGDLYVQNDLEVDGSITGTLKVSDFDGTMYTALNGNLTAISGMFWSNTNSLLAIGDSVGSDGKLQLQKSSADTVANNSSVSQIYISVDDFGVVTSGFDSNYGQKMIIARTGATGGTITTVGSQITVSGDNAGAGTHTAYGQIITVSGTPDTVYGLRVTVPTYATSYAATFSGGNVGIGITAPTAKLEVKDGHYASSQTTLPTESVVTYTQGTVTAGSTDTKGQFTVTTTAATGSVTLLFTTAYVSAPTCVISPASANTQVDADKTYVTTATNGLTVNYNQAPTANLQTWNYICMQ